MRQPPLHVGGRPDNGHTEASFIEAHQPARAGVQTDEVDVGEVLRCDLHERHEEWLRAQHLRDLEMLDRIEGQIEERAGEGGS